MCKDNELPNECEQSQKTAPHGVDVERLLGYMAMNRVRQENQKREVIIGKLFDASRKSSLINSHISAWEAGNYQTFEQMLVELVLSMHGESEQLKKMVLNDLNMRPGQGIILK